MTTLTILTKFQYSDHLQLNINYNHPVMDFFRRIGTQRHKFKLEFFIKRIIFNKTIAGKIYLTIKRGDHKLTTEHQVETDKERLTANFQNQILTFPSITLFYQESESKYQEKPGEIKVIMLTNKGDKKLLGMLNFDVAEYANQHKQNFKFKEKLEEMPAKLDAQLQFQVYLKFMGEASETDKSIKQQKRGESPLDKISSFFSGLVGNNEEDKSKVDQKSSNSKVNSPKKKDQRNRQSIDQHTSQTNQGISKRQKKKKRQSPPQEEGVDYKSAIEKSKKKAEIKARPSSDVRKQTDNNNSNNQAKSKHKRPQKQQKKAVAEQQLLFQNYQPNETEKQLKNKTKKEHRQRVSHQYQQQQNNTQSSAIKNISKVAKPPIAKKEQNYEQSNKINKEHGSQQNVQSEKRIETKNIKATDSKIKTVDDGYSQRTPKNKYEQVPQFYFEDPLHFPPEQGQKKQNTNLAIVFENPKQEIKLDRKESKQKKVVAEPVDISSKVEQSESPKKPTKKIKQNTIQIIKDTDEKLKMDQQKRKSKESQVFGPQPMDKVNNRKQESIQPKEAHKREINLSSKVADKQQSSKGRVLPEQNVESLEQSQVENLFEPLDVGEKPNQKLKVQLKESLLPKKPIDPKPKVQDQPPESSQLRKENEQLKSKIKEDSNQINKLREQAKLNSKQIKQLQSKLRQTEQSGQQKIVALEKSITDLGKDKQSLEKQIQKLKAENTTMKKQIANSNKNQSFFRQTERQYQEKSMDQDPEQEIKRLQKQKNQQLIINQQQKDKYRKQVKKFTQQLQKEKIKYKQLQDASKVDLKKLKDQCSKLNALIENIKNENSQKSKQNTVLIEDNKQSNDIIIELREKLASIKLKICEKLNEANEKQQAELMQALTDLSEDI